MMMGTILTSKKRLSMYNDKLFIFERAGMKDLTVEEAKVPRW